MKNIDLKLGTPIWLSVALTLCLSSGAAAQPGTFVSEGQTSVQVEQDSSVTLTRPGMTTFFGDTGLWFVPTAEVLSHGRWSVSGYRRGTNFTQGFANVGDFSGTFGVGLSDRVELFGSFLFITRVERDLRPIFINDPDVGGILAGYPHATTGWTGNKRGDFYLGAKVNLLSESRGNPVAMAVRAMVKAPTGDTDAGASNGKTDLSLDFIVSREIGRVADLAGYAGYDVRGQPEGFEAPDGALRWGVGAGFPSRSPIRATLELNGVAPNSETLTLAGATIIGIDGSLPPLVSTVRSLTRATMGLTWQAPNGFFIGAGYSWNVPREDRGLYVTDEDGLGDFADLQVRLGYYPGGRLSLNERLSREEGRRNEIARQAAAETAAQDAARQADREAQASQAAAQAAAAQAAAAQAAASQAAASQAAASQAAASQAAGSQAAGSQATGSQATGSQAAASQAAAAQQAASAATVAFEDVHFDFDRYTLRPDAARLLDDAASALDRNPTLRIVIEGHTCNIGTAEYNLALGDRRASAVRAYLIARGVAASRLTTISYGEERPKHDNSREETRRLNRRAALVVSIQ
jgi:outer membrane protein OmpA-like peptidoglycan-associated protein